MFSVFKLATLFELLNIENPFELNRTEQLFIREFINIVVKRKKKSPKNNMPFFDGVIQVAWIKADAKAILAIHEHVITNSDRLSVTHNDFNTWTLVIRNVRMEDRGQYMCQVSHSIKFVARMLIQFIFFIWAF